MLISTLFAHGDIVLIYLRDGFQRLSLDAKEWEAINNKSTTRQNLFFFSVDDDFLHLSYLSQSFHNKFSNHIRL